MENIATASKKRKFSHDREEEDNEEEKMEKFYALVKNLREARDRLMRGSYATKEMKSNRREENKRVEVWKPTFQREDFLEEIDHLKNPPLPVKEPPHGIDPRVGVDSVVG